MGRMDGRDLPQGGMPAQVRQEVGVGPVVHHDDCVVRARQQGYAIRHDYAPFLARYGHLSKSVSLPDASLTTPFLVKHMGSATPPYSFSPLPSRENCCYRGKMSGQSEACAPEIVLQFYCL